MSFPEYTNWEVVMFCMSCNEHLSHRQYHDNDGVCVHCGAVSAVLPDVKRKARRKHYTDGRKLAIAAQKLRNSNIFVRLVARFSRKKMVRPFTWEYKKGEINDFSL